MRAISESLNFKTVQQKPFRPKQNKKKMDEKSKDCGIRPGVIGVSEMEEKTFPD